MPTSTYAAAFVARRSGNGHVGTLVRQLDEVLYASFVASYILDANFLNFIIRCVSQLQFSSPKEHHPERSLKFHVTAAAVINFLNIIYHIGVPLTWDPRGITIDFVGQSSLPSPLQLFIFDSIAAFLQLFLIVLTYETSHYGNEADLDDGYDLDPDEADEEQQLLRELNSPQADEQEEVEPDYSVSSAEDRPILDFRLRQTLHRIVHDKPLSTVDETETETSGNSGSEDSQARLHRLQQARTRSRRRRMGQS